MLTDPTEVTLLLAYRRAKVETPEIAAWLESVCGSVAFDEKSDVTVDEQLTADGSIDIVSMCRAEPVKSATNR